MSTLAIRLRYRPLRIGWCVARGDFDAFRRAACLSFTMWGGRFNPIVPIEDAKVARALVSLFRIDALYPVTDTPEVNAFAEGFKHIPWPFIRGRELFTEAGEGERGATVVDISHPATQIYNDTFKNNPDAGPGLELFEWEKGDPLSDLFLSTFGAFPPPEETGTDYRALVETSLHGFRSILRNGEEVPRLPINRHRHSISALNRAGISTHYAIQNFWDEPGFYLGEIDNFDDIVHFWNLKAADIPVLFFDSRYATRLRAMVTPWIEAIRQAPARPHGPHGIAIWHREERAIDGDRAHFGDGAIVDCRVGEGTWNGLNVRAPIIHFGDGSTTLGSVSEGGGPPTISFALAGQPFTNAWETKDQHYVLSVDPGIGLFGNERATLHTPFIPELNEFYGRKAYFMWDAARAEPDSLGIVTRVSTDHLSLRALDVNELISRIFEVVGIEASPSKAGLVASTLIRQMGGLDGCRPFKIAGVRALIENHRPDQSFSRSTAKQTIRGQGSVRPLSEYQWLYIEPRKGSELTSDAVLSYLLDKGVFRAGLKFDCPSCRLEFWRTLDDTRSRLECDYCGHAFNIAPQLRDKDWAFRRSGLFGRDDHQEGAIPVLLTLQQLMRTHRSEAIFTTAMTLKAKGADIRRCETDFIVLTNRGRGDKIQVVIGECKTRKPINERDVANLKAVADAFPSDRYEVFVVFARLTPFSSEEVERVKQVNGRYQSRAIMFTERELEPYFVYERTAQDFDISRTAVSFQQMVTATGRVFFEERRRPADVDAEEGRAAT